MDQFEASREVLDRNSWSSRSAPLLSLHIDSASVSSTEDDESKYEKNRNRMVGAVWAYKKLARFVGWVDTLNKNRVFVLIFQVFLWAMLSYELYAGYIVLFQASNMKPAANQSLNRTINITKNITGNQYVYYLVGQLITDFVPYLIYPIVINFYLHFRRDRPWICTMASTLLDDASARAPRTSMTTYRDFKVISQKPLRHLQATFWVAVVFFGPLFLTVFSLTLVSGRGEMTTFRKSVVSRVTGFVNYLTVVYITVEYVSAVACAAYEYEHAYAEAGLKIRTRKQSESSAKREDVQDDDDVRHERAISNANSVHEGQILQSYRQHYIDARNAINKQNSYYGVPIGFTMVTMALIMVYKFLVMFNDGNVWAGAGGVLRGLPIFCVVFTTAYANFQIDSFSTYILEDSAYTFEFAIKYSACELHHHVNTRSRSFMLL